MYLPPGMLESLDHKYRPEPFDSTVETGEVVVSHVSGGREGLSWPVKAFHVKPESWSEIGIGFLFLLFGLWYGASVIQGGDVVEIRRALFILALGLWLPFYTTRHLIRRIYPERLGSVTLDTRGLIRDRGRDAEPKSIQ